ncbi:MAG: regulatory protein RecX [Acidobacteriota bacterium]
MSEVSCFDRAVKLLSLRSHFELELRAKLQKRSYSSDDIDAAIERCVEFGYLDDAKTAQEFARAKRARGGWGRRKVEAELRRRGVSGEALQDALEEDEDGELERAFRAAEKAARRRDDRDSIARHLSGKGFSPHVILTVLDRRGQSEDEAF